MSIQLVADEQLVPGVRAVTVNVLRETDLDAAAVAGHLRRTLGIGPEVSCHGEGAPVTDGVQWVFLFTADPNPSAGQH